MDLRKYILKPVLQEIERYFSSEEFFNLVLFFLSHGVEYKKYEFKLTEEPGTAFRVYLEVTHLPTKDRVKSRILAI